MGETNAEELERELSKLSSRPAAERAEFLTRLGWSREGEPVPGVEPFLDDPELLVRIAAAQARWQMAHDEAELDRLVGILAGGLSNEDEDLALMAGTALVNMEEAPVAALIRWCEARGKGASAAVRVLGEIAGEQAERYLERAARSEDPEVASEAREALDAIADETKWER